MTQQPINKAEQAKAALRQRGTSLYAWARAHGFEERTVYRAVDLWAGRSDRVPRGRLTRQILNQLRAELGPDLLPEPNPGREAA